MTALPSDAKPAEISTKFFAGGPGIFLLSDGVFSNRKCGPAIRRVRESTGEVGFTHNFSASSGRSFCLVQLSPRSRERKSADWFFFLSPATTYITFELAGSIAIAVMVPKGLGSAIRSSSAWSELILISLSAEGLGYTRLQVSPVSS